MRRSTRRPAAPPKPPERAERAERAQSTALSPYLVEEVAFTLEEIRRARAAA